jgi:hypothetical protein
LLLDEGVRTPGVLGRAALLVDVAVEQFRLEQRVVEPPGGALAEERRVEPVEPHVAGVVGVGVAGEERAA